MAKIGRVQLVACLLLAAVTVAVYWPATRCDFVNYDDFAYVVENGAIQHGVTPKAIAWAFANTYAVNWHPLTWLSHAVDCWIYGVKPWGHHLTSVILHAGNSVLLFLLLLEMAGGKTSKLQTPNAHQSSARTLWICAVLAGMFAWHPLRVESVAWISERKDVLSAFFFFSTLLAYIRYAKQEETKKGTRFYYALALVFFALGLLSKQMVVTAPFVMLLMDYWPLGRVQSPSPESSRLPRSHALTLRRLFAEKIPFLVMAIGASVVVTIAQRDESISSLEALPIGSRIANVLVSYVLYLWQTVWPASLAVMYPYVDKPFWQVAGAALLLAAITAFVLWQWKRRPYLAFGWLWFLGMLVPVIGFVQVGFQSRADRYTYLPSIGLLIMIGGAVAEMLRVPWSAQRPAARNSPHTKEASNGFQVSPFIFRASGIAVACVLTALIFLTQRQIATWQNGVTLFTHSLAVEGESFYPTFCLGLAKEHAGDISGAINCYLRANQLPLTRLEQPRVWWVYSRLNLGNLYRGRGQWGEAEATYRELLAKLPGAWKARTGLADCLQATGRLDEALTEYQAVISVNPTNRYLWRQLGVTLNRQGKSTEALNAYREACRLTPDGVDELNDLAWFLATDPHEELRDPAEAVRLAQRACELTGNQAPQCLGTLDAAYAAAGRLDDAIKTARQAEETARKGGREDVASAAAERLAKYEKTTKK